MPAWALVSEVVNDDRQRHVREVMMPEAKKKVEALHAFIESDPTFAGWWFSKESENLNAAIERNVYWSGDMFTKGSLPGDPMGVRLLGEMRRLGLSTFWDCALSSLEVRNESWGQSFDPGGSQAVMSLNCGLQLAYLFSEMEAVTQFFTDNLEKVERYREDLKAQAATYEKLYREAMLSLSEAHGYSEKEPDNLGFCELWDYFRERSPLKPVVAVRGGSIGEIEILHLSNTMKSRPFGSTDSFQYLSQHVIYEQVEVYL